MSTIAKFLTQPPDGFSTQISSATVASDALSVALDSTSGLPTEGIGQFFKKDANGNLVAGSVEFCHWTNVSGSTITFSDTGDRGITGSDSGAQSYVADDYFEVWASSYYVGGYGGLTEHTAAGLHNYATVAQINTGTSTSLVINPDKLAGSNLGTRLVQLVVFDDSTEVSTGDGAGDIVFRVPAEMNGMDLVSAAACQETASTGTGSETVDIQIHNITQAADMLSTVLTIDEDETDSSTAATAAVIDTANDDVATADQIRIDVDAIPSTTGGNGLFMTLGFRTP